MSTTVSDAAANAGVDAILALPADLVALHTGDPGADGSANELTVGTAPGYARAAVAWDPAAAGVAGNSGTVEFSAVGGDWPNVTHVSIWKDDVVDVFLIAALMTAPVQITDGQKIRFVAGTLQASLAGLVV